MCKWALYWGETLYFWRNWRKFLIYSKAPQSTCQIPMGKFLIFLQKLLKFAIWFWVYNIQTWKEQQHWEKKNSFSPLEFIKPQNFCGKKRMLSIKKGKKFFFVRLRLAESETLFLEWFSFLEKCVFFLPTEKKFHRKRFMWHAGIFGLGKAGYNESAIIWCVWI